MSDDTVVGDGPIEAVAVHPDTGRPVRLGLALVLISIAQLMVVLDATIANIALPFIGKDLDIIGTNLTWIVTGYSLVFGGLLLLGGRLGDLYGRRRIFMIGLVIFAVASLLGGLAPERDAAARRPWPPGPRCRARLARRAGPDHHHLPGRAGPQPGVRGLRRHVRRRRGRRPDPRRLAHRLPLRALRHRHPRLAADLPHQRADRHRRPPCSRRASCPSPSRTRVSSTSRAPSPAPRGLLALVYGLTHAGNPAYGWNDPWTITSLVGRRRPARAVRRGRVAGSSTRCCRSGSSPTGPAPRASWR